MNIIVINNYLSKVQAKHMSYNAKAKLNLFLGIKKKKDDGYHNIHTGVTFLNLHNEISISRSKKNFISYTGPFAPKNRFYKDDILYKVIKLLNINEKKKLKINIKIKKNIPTGAGLGSASADAAALLRGLKKLKLIKKIPDNTYLSLIGADIPMCIKSRDCIATGIGEKIKLYNKFSKYYFVLVKPNFSLSTRKIYSKIKLNNKTKSRRNILKIKNPKIFGNIQGNDLQKIAIKLKPSIKSLLKELSMHDGNLISRMSGSGPTCFAMFKVKSKAIKAHQKIISKYPKWWSYLAENK